MKKIITLVLAALFCSAMLVPASAVRDWVEPVGDVYAPFVTTPPTLDGIISEGEWCKEAAFIINDWNMVSVVSAGFMELPEGWETVMHYAWDNDYFYFASECKDPTTVGRPFGSSSEGDYFRMSLNFNQTVEEMWNTPYITWCLVEDPETGTYDKYTLMISEVLEGDTSWVTDDIWGCTAVKDDHWTYEVRVPWSVISEMNKKFTGSEVTVSAGTDATGLIMYCDFDDNYKYVNWFGTQSFGYESAAWFGPSGFGIDVHFVGSEADVKARPETTEPKAETEPEDTTNNTPATAQDTDDVTEPTEPKGEVTTAENKTTEKTEENEGGLNTGALIGIIAAAVVIVAAVVVAIVLSKKKK